MMRVILVSMLGAFVVTGCDDLAGCENEVIIESPSPGGGLKAVLFQRSCGATTGLSSQISIVALTGIVSGGGNAFSADTDHGKARAGVWGGPDVQMEWQSPRSLTITYAVNARIFRREAEVSGVSIGYQTSGQ